MKIINAPYKIECQMCNKMKNLFVAKNDKLICLACLKSKNGAKQRHKKCKLSKEQIESIKKNLDEYYKKRGSIKIIYGGCFN